jgi:hypothetical protein
MADNAEQRLWQQYSSQARLQAYREQFAKVML